ncbi:GntR family transcriptional regulator [Streptococcus ratti]|uniref:Transcriptional regulator n=1 Tax=Streptococcus ratti FA-1 = DSM 20564 TaxID=699248 RepID=A0ABP2QYS8_STRRT|nr:GntR family transcriptional regulator [Streptococcus ratti]EJN94019.1 putative transcriptional regulator [Streptococcus ratti FA-1 = DSM 20564]EMP70132.1 putative transcriptional regulator [Streptococcus ratti FA-1 = DSM 20564]QEY07853.1 GntR family transcriptional regulator [Streptococcus ratti]VEI60323.1 transcriptional regulator [Streptococcus mutans]
MAWKFDEKSPIYLQIANHIKMQIISQEIKPGQQLPTVRDLAEEAGVNPNTMQRAFTSLEQENMVFSVRTSGRFVTEDLQLIEEERHKLAQTELKSFIDKMTQFGFSKDKLVTVLDQYIKGESQ